MNDIRPDELCRTITGLSPRCGRTVVVAIDGPSGAGKTLLAQHLAEQLRAENPSGIGPRDALVRRVEILHLDHVYPGWHGLAQTPPVVARDILAPISVGRPGRTPRWDWGADAPGTDLVVPPPDVLILDGCGSGARVIRPYLSQLVWLDAPADVRRERAEGRGDDTVAQWWDLWAEQEAAHFAAEGTQAAADLVIAS